MITETFSNRCLMVSKSLHHLKVCLHNKFWSHICIIMRPQLKISFGNLWSVYTDTQTECNKEVFETKSYCHCALKTSKEIARDNGCFESFVLQIQLAQKKFFKKLFNKKGEGGTFPQKTAKLRLYSLNGINQKTSTTKYMLDSLLNSKLLRQILTDI